MITLQTYRSTDEDLGQHLSFNKQRYRPLRLVPPKEEVDDLILLRDILYVANETREQKRNST